MSRLTHLECTRCGEHFPADRPQTVCPKDGGILYARYDLESIKKLDTPFGQATTTSLEAFRAYALGDKAHVSARDIPEAEGHYLRAIELDPNFAMAYARLGVVYINTNQSEAAEAAFKKAIELDPNYADAYYQLGLVLIGLLGLAAVAWSVPAVRLRVRRWRPRGQSEEWIA